MYNIFLFLYSIGLRLVSPWNEKARLWLKGRKQFPVFMGTEKTIWMHCASLGEFEQGRPLLEEMKKKYPSYKIALSFFSPSGYEVSKNYPGADYIFYLPMDNILHAKRLIASLDPALVLWVKYEYWYYYLAELKKRNIPVILVSGIFRKNQPFFKWYGEIWKKMLGCFDQLFVQDEASVALLESIAVKKNVLIGGDTRFDRVIAIAEKNEPVDHISSFIGNSRVLVAGSTWEEDDIELLHFVKTRPDIKFIIAPHVVFKEKLADIIEAFSNAIFYSAVADDNSLLNKANVLIIDNVGMLAKLYKYADIAYVGGGFGTEGIHNVLEAAVYGKPVVFGPVYHKFAEASGLIDCGGAYSVTDPLELDRLLTKLFNDSALVNKSGNAARNYVLENKGATKKILDHIEGKRLLTI